MAKRPTSSIPPAPTALNPPPRKSAPPAWKSRIGLIVTFFTITIGGSYAYLAFMNSSTAEEFDYKIAAKYPHDSQAFTEGLVYRDGILYESTGLVGKSSIRKYDLATQTLVGNVKMDDRYFGEGLTLWQDRLVQLTYRNEIALQYDLDLRLTGKQFSYEGEGWGLTTDGRHLIMSNGSSTLQFLDPETFAVVRQIRVLDGNRAVSPLNELEFVDGLIYANIWHRDYIVAIHPETGQVTARIYLAGLLPASQRPNAEAVLNGIAYNDKTRRLIVTGKYWPELFEIEMVPRKKR